MGIASAFISLTYYYPRLWTSNLNACYCRLLWSSALVSYVTSMFLLKAMYVKRIHVLSDGSMLGTPRTRKALKITSIILIILYIICLSLLTFQTDGECHPQLNHNGCITKFHVADIYSAMVMIVVDGILFGTFCWKWKKMITIFKMSENDHKIPIKVMQSFIIQFSLTITAMSSSFLDTLLHLILHDKGKNYHIMNIFLFDCAIIATCNFCMISESQVIVRRFLCFCCSQIGGIKQSHPLNKRDSLGKPSVKDLTNINNNKNSNINNNDHNKQNMLSSNGNTKLNTLPSISCSTECVTPDLVIESTAVSIQDNNINQKQEIKDCIPGEDDVVVVNNDDINLVSK